ncbi:hypothetical protein FRC08_005680, partial [Ceratobasidium sp. 394]
MSSAITRLGCQLLSTHKTPPSSLAVSPSPSTPPSPHLPLASSPRRLVVSSTACRLVGAVAATSPM